MYEFASEFGFTPDQLEALTTRAGDLAEAGEFEDAIVVLQGLIALCPQEPEYHWRLGSVMRRQGKPAEAEAAYDAALALWPRAPLALLNRGELRCQRGDLGGLADLRAAAQLEGRVRSQAEALLRRFSVVG